MCGISGFLSSGAKIEAGILAKMSDAVKHRGPDDSGLLYRFPVGMAHRRLSVIDLSDRAHQPMESGAVTLVYNGEIYNYRELREELDAAGYTFKSDSDTEVIAVGYRHWGRGLWPRLEGMFSIALWDDGNKNLFLVRDSFGIKPLYYYQGTGYMLFCSEIKGLLASGLVPREIDANVLYHYLSYFYTPSPETVIKGVRHVRPGVCLSIDKEGVMREEEFDYRVPSAEMPCVPEAAGEKEVLDIVRQQTRDAVKKSMIADVPVGLVLSGGMDSNVLLYEMANTYTEKIRTFTVSFKDPSFDESKQAQEASRHFGMENIQFVFDEKMVQGYYDKVVYHNDSLNANPAAIPSYIFFKLASKHVKVVLSGTAGDELFGGYSTYIADAINSYYCRLPVFFRRAAYLAAQKLPVRHGIYSFGYLAKKFTEGALFNDFDKSHYWWRTIFTDSQKKQLFRPDFINGIRPPEDDSFIHYKRALQDISDNGIPMQERYMRADTRLFLGDNAVRMFDAMSMAHSVECRPPFLHQRYVQFCRSLPLKYKIRGLKKKYCLRRAYAAYLPEGVASRKKRGLLAPLAGMFCADLRPFLEDNLSKEKIDKIGYFNYRYIRKLMDEHYDKKSDNSFHLNTLLTFVRWHDIFIKNS